MSEKLPTAITAPESLVQYPRVQTFFPEAPSREIILLDKSDPRAVVNLVPEDLRQHIEDMAFENPEYFNQDERSLRALFKEANKNGKLTHREAEIGATENRIRVAFWTEYNRAQDSGGRMNLANVCAGICTKAYFYNEITKRKTKLAWVLTPPTSYTSAMEEALIYGVEKIRDILDIELKDSKGNVNVKAAEVLLKTIQFLDQRVKGAIVQKVDTRSLVVHADTRSKPKESEPLTLEAVQKQLQSLEAKATELLKGKGQSQAPLEPKEPEVLPAESSVNES